MSNIEYSFSQQNIKNLASFLCKALKIRILNFEILICCQRWENDIVYLVDIYEKNEIENIPIEKIKEIIKKEME